MLCTYLLNQLDRYLLGTISKPIEDSLNFGDGKGGGLKYQLLAGPAFTLAYTLTGIPIGMLADRLGAARRKDLLAACLLLWSTCTGLSGLTNNYVELFLARFGLGIGEAGCTPLASGIIAAYFAPSVRGTAFGVYNWGIYLGYSMSFAMGNFLATAVGWRGTFGVAGVPGFLVSILIYVTIKPVPDRVVDSVVTTPPLDPPEDGGEDAGTVVGSKYKTVRATVTSDNKPSALETIKFFLTGSALRLLCLAGAVRNAAGYTWAVNTQPFFVEYRQLTDSEVGQWMSWIPLVAGSLGAVFGGFVSDHLVKHRGPHARILVIIVSQLAAAPFSAGAVYLPTTPDAPSPWPFLCLIPANIIGEMWVGVALATVLDLVPKTMSVTAIAVYLFVITNIGGNANVLVSPLRQHLSYEATLLILYPGMYLASAVLFAATLAVLQSDVDRAKQREGKPMSGLNERLIESGHKLADNDDTDTVDGLEDISPHDFAEPPSP